MATVATCAPLWADHRDRGPGLAGQLPLVGLLQAGLADHARRVVRRAELAELLGGDRPDRADDARGQAGVTALSAVPVWNTVPGIG